MTRKIVVIFGIAIWALAIGCGLVFLTDYGTRPSRQAQAPLHLPTAFLRERQRDLPTLLLFAHPHCPCTRATLAELARLLAQQHGRVQVQVLFYRPLTQSQAWVESKLWHQAQRLPAVTVATVNELELLRFGVSTSGQALLYNANGKLVFSGGITGARGHEGNNTGRSAISTYLQNGYLLTSQTPVFGCSIGSSLSVEDEG